MTYYCFDMCDFIYFVFFYCFFFFFFKQKTAYEMRISDWSSDVCSSDLAIYRRSGGERPPSRRRRNGGASSFFPGPVTPRDRSRGDPDPRLLAQAKKLEAPP